MFDSQLLVLLPLLVLSAFLFLVLSVLICLVLVRRRRGIILSDSDGPQDLSREDHIESDGAFPNIESAWLQHTTEPSASVYLRAKQFQLQYPPNSQPTDITLSQFLSIQEKGVSAWSFEPDFDTVNSLLVHARTEITFLPDPASSSCVQSNLPLPKLNEVYYWEVKLFDLPESTNVAIGLATKPYPPFRLPGFNRYSVAYHSTGEKSHNFPFTIAPFGPLLKEADVLGVGYRPRNGSVFFTRNGRKMEDAFVGLTRWNLFPTIGADGPCSVHVNLGQAGFVFIEANVKKWGLAPSVGTLAPPPAYGAERGSILLDVGGRLRAPSSPNSNRHRSRRLRHPSIPSSEPPTPLTPPPPITPIDETDDDTDDPSAPLLAVSRSVSPSSATPSPGARNPFTNHRHQRSITHFPNNTLSAPGPATRRTTSEELTVHLLPPPDSPMSPNMNPPTPGQLDIHLQALPSAHRRVPSTLSNNSPATINNHDDDSDIDSPTPTASPAMTPTITDRLLPSPTRKEPPAYSPLDAYTYADGVHIDLPADVIAAALEGASVPPDAVGQSSNTRPPSERRRSHRRR